MFCGHSLILTNDILITPFGGGGLKHPIINLLHYFVCSLYLCIQCFAVTFIMCAQHRRWQKRLVYCTLLTMTGPLVCLGHNGPSVFGLFLGPLTCTDQYVYQTFVHTAADSSSVTPPSSFLPPHQMWPSFQTPGSAALRHSGACGSALEGFRLNWFCLYLYLVRWGYLDEIWNQRMDLSLGKYFPFCFAGSPTSPS